MVPDAFEPGRTNRREGDIFVADRHNCPYCVFQFTNIARPRVLRKKLEHSLAQFGRPSEQSGKLSRKMLCQDWNVLLALTQGWEAQAKTTDPAIEILAELATA